MLSDYTKLSDTILSADKMELAFNMLVDIIVLSADNIISDNVLLSGDIIMLDNINNILLDNSMLSE
jgi:2-phospho-L-lactate guanylyltransferase (CobY/MobA/RfbA family)